MSMRLNPYINFKDNTREAMEYYQSIFGGELIMNKYKDFHVSEDPSEDEKIMHSVLETDEIMFMASDTPNSLELKAGGTINMSISGEDKEKLREYFNKLAEGGRIDMPFEKAPWGDIFGMVTDKFGVTWMVNANQTT